MAGAGFGLAASGMSGVSLGAAAVGFVVGLALMLPGHVLGATGAGDVKLMAAVGAIVGPRVVVNAFLFTAVAGGSPRGGRGAAAAAIARHARRHGESDCGAGGREREIQARAGRRAGSHTDRRLPSAACSRRLMR